MTTVEMRTESNPSYFGGMSWSHHQNYPDKSYTSETSMTFPSATTTLLGLNDPLSTPWATAANNLAAHITSSMPTPPESPPPGRSDEEDYSDATTTNNTISSADTVTSNSIKRTSNPVKCHNGLISETTTKLRLQNILHVSTKNQDRYFLTRQCCYVFHCLSLRTRFNYPAITNKLILNDDRVKAAMEQSISEEMEQRGLEADDTKAYSTLLAQHTARVHKILKDMKAAISSTLIRITGYVLFKVFSNLLMSITIHGGQQEVIKKAVKRDTPVIFVPLHRSHVDYLFVTWVLFNQQIPAPIVAAGDNLRLPVFGSLLRGLGGFFIKRRLESTKNKKDILYRSVLQTYVTYALQAGYNLEFFIEGGRTRTGKPCMPKGGLLSVIVDAYMNGTLDDALIVPIAINYDKLLDGNFIHEQMGQSKVPESFWGAVRAIIQVLCTNYGHARIDFGQPFSLREFVVNSKAASPLLTPNLLQECTPPHSPTPASLSPVSLTNDTQPPFPVISSKGHYRSHSTPASNNHLITTSSNKLHTARSNSSLFGTEVTQEYRSLIKSLASHIVYDAERCQALMSTNVVAWLLSFAFRNGTTMSNLTKALDTIRESFRTRERDTGFSGTSEDVINHAVELLGAGLVRIEKADTCEEDFIRPVTMLPNVIELGYYANAMTPLFAVDAIVATSLISLLDVDIWSYRDCSVDVFVNREKLIKKATRLTQIFQFEFLFAPPCASLEARLHQSVDNLIIMGLLVDAGRSRSTWSDDSDSEDISFSQSYKIAPSSSSVEVVQTWINMLTPLIDAYYCTCQELNNLINKQLTEKVFLQSIQSSIREKLDEGTVKYGESICIDALRNSIKLLETLSVIESYTQNNLRVIYLSQDYDSEEQLLPLINEIDSYRS